MKKYTLAIVGVVLALACLLVAFWGINFRELGGALSHAEYFWLIPAMFFVLVSMIFRAATTMVSRASGSTFFLRGVIRGLPARYATL